MCVSVCVCVCVCVYAFHFAHTFKSTRRPSRLISSPCAMLERAHADTHAYADADARAHTWRV